MRMLEVFSSEKTYSPVLQDASYVVSVIEQVLHYMIQNGKCWWVRDRLSWLSWSVGSTLALNTAWDMAQSSMHSLGSMCLWSHIPTSALVSTQPSIWKCIHSLPLRFPIACKWNELMYFCCQLSSWACWSQPVCGAVASPTVAMQHWDGQVCQWDLSHWAAVLRHCLSSQRRGRHVVSGFLPSLLGQLCALTLWRGWHWDTSVTSSGERLSNAYDFTSFMMN